MTFDKLDPDWAWERFEASAETPWNAAMAAHLFRRAGFAANWEDIQAAAAEPPEDAIARLLDAEEGDFAGQMRQLGRTVLGNGEPERLTAWWLYRMRHTPAPLLEKMILFWHGHFATSADKVTRAQLMMDQHQLLRRHALGDFGKLVQGIARDPAMLIYLDSATNRKTHPNENFAREVMELFCLGLDQYTEQDIQELARCFTGWEVRFSKFRFNPYQHDDGSKTLLGASGAFDGDEAIEVILQQPAAAQFMARKLIRFYMFDEPEAPEALVEPLAAEIRRHDFQMRPVMHRLLGSRLFLSPLCVGRKVRSPVELVVGLLRSLEATAGATDMAAASARLGQRLFFPPNVKGWDGGRVWLNASTILERANVAGRLVRGKEVRFAGGDLTTLAKKYDVEPPREFVDFALNLLLAVQPPAAARERLIDLAERSGASPAARAADVVQAIAALPEFQLA